MKLRLGKSIEDALVELAIAERREPRAQAEYLVIKELERRGLLLDTLRGALPAAAADGNVLGKPKNVAAVAVLEETR